MIVSDNGRTDGSQEMIRTEFPEVILIENGANLGFGTANNRALAPDIIAIFAGSQYAASVLTIRLLSPIVIIVGLAYFTGLQVLYPHRQEWKYTVSVSVAAVANAIFNALMIPRLAQNGAALGTVLAECVGLIL